MAMRTLLIVNPKATRFRTQTCDRVTAALHAEHQLEVVQTTHRGHATALTRTAMSEGVELVVVLGGDGTINEVVNGFTEPDVLLGVVGGGKTDVFVRGLGLPRDPTKATAAMLKLLAGRQRRRVSLGQAGNRRFVVGAGLGLDGAVVHEVERRRQQGQRHRDWMYVAAMLKTILADYDRDTPHLSVHFSDRRPTAAGFFALVANGDPFSYLGPRALRPMPEATFEGGLDILVGESMFPPLLTRAVVRMLSANPPTVHRRLPVFHDERVFQLQSDMPLALQVDGEYLGDRTSVEFAALPEAVTVVAPPDGTAGWRRHG